jgi:hypothetical protein
MGQTAKKGHAQKHAEPRGAAEDKTKKKRENAQLDEALEESFPASDPVSISQPKADPGD